MNEQDNQFDSEVLNDDSPARPYSAARGNTPILKGTNPDFEEIPVENIGIIGEDFTQSNINNNTQVVSEPIVMNETSVEPIIDNIEEAVEHPVFNNPQYGIENPASKPIFSSEQAIDNLEDNKQPVEEYINPQFSGAIINPNMVNTPNNEPIQDVNFVNPAVAAYSEAYHAPEEKQKNNQRNINRNNKPINTKELLVAILIFAVLFIFTMFLPTFDKLISNIF